jgi:acetolactate synthase-1/3 small subunit
MKMDNKRHLLTLLVDNEPGVLSRIVGLFSGRGFNIESLCVAPTLDSAISRLTITTEGNPAVIEQIEKQLNKLINVIKVRDLSVDEAVKREMVLIRVKANAQTRAEILRIVDIFRCKVVDVGSEQYTLEATGDVGKIEALLKLLKPMGIKEIARTGTVALYREP